MALDGGFSLAVGVAVGFDAEEHAGEGKHDYGIEDCGASFAAKGLVGEFHGPRREGYREVVAELVVESAGFASARVLVAQPDFEDCEALGACGFGHGKAPRWVRVSR